jgi:uncharacterized protein (DUF362 family)
MQVTRRTFLQKILLALSSDFLLKTFFKKNVNAYMSRVKTGKTEIIETKVLQRSTQNMSTVVSIYSPNVTKWDYKTYPYVDYIDSDNVKKMLNEGVKSLTGEESSSNAWRSLFISYKRGDKVAIKPNFNDLHNGFHGLVASPTVINAIMDGLVNIMKIPPKDIIIYDCTRIISDEFRSRIHFSVRYIEPYGSSFWRKVEYRTIGNPLVKADHKYEISMKSYVRDKSGRPVKCYMPKVITDAQHVINVPILKSHQFISHSGALKNHYGTVRFSDSHGGPDYLHPPIIDQSITDINSHDQIRKKTRLIVMDALYGRLKKKGGPPDRWNTFRNGSPNRLFISRDPVALDSVSYHFIKKEMESHDKDILSHDYLHIAQDHGLGIHEDTDSTGRFKKINFKEIEI